MAGLRRVGPETQVNAQFGSTVDTTTGDQDRPAAALFPSGRAVVVYEDFFTAADTDIQANFLAAQSGSPTGVQFAPPGLGFSAQDDRNPDAVALANVGDPSIPQNRTLIVWDVPNAATGRDIFGRQVNGNGDPVTAAPVPLIVAAGDQEFVKAAAFANGRSVLTWQDTTAGTVGAAVLGVDGQSIAVAPFDVGTGTRPVAAALAGNTFVVSWVGTDVSGTGIRAQLFDGTTGARLGNELGTAQNPLNVSTTLDQTEVAVAALSNGNFVVAWTDASTRPDQNGITDASGTAIKMRLFNGSGQAVSGELVANTGTIGNQTAPSVAAGPNGSFVVAWTDAGANSDASGRLDASGTGIKAQAFDAAGARLGGEILVNTLTAGNQDRVDLAAGQNGAILAVFEDASGQVDGGAQSPDGSGIGVQAVRLQLDLPVLVPDSDVFRFFNSRDGGHFFTINEAERQQVLATRPDLRPEGVGFDGFTTATLPDTAPVFRFFNTRDGGHFFTISTAERDQVLATRPDLTFEGIAFYEFTASQGANTEAVFRFFSTRDGGHFFTSSVAERNIVQATRPDLLFEGISFYAPTQSADFFV